MSILEEGLSCLNLAYTQKQLQLLQAYISEIEMWNSRYGLVNATGDNLTRKHIHDSLTGVEHIIAMGSLSLADVGSGGGLPGIPLAILLPKCKITLIERSGKKARFLRNVQPLLGLDNLILKEADLKDVNETFDLVTWRAFKPLEPEIIRHLFGILKDSGKFLAYKGRMSEINLEIERVKEWVKVEKIISVKIPELSDERNLVLCSPQLL